MTRCTLATFALLLSSACSDGASTPFGTIPPDPDAGASMSSAVTTFAVDEIFLGDTTRAHAASTSAWMDYGYDIDGLQTTAASANTCILQPNTPLANQADGRGGIDNSWGSTMLPIFETAFGETSASASATHAIADGDWTLLVQVEGLSDDPKQTASHLTAQVFVGAPTAPPAFDSTTDWPLRPSSVADANAVPFTATVQFKDVYVSDGTVVARGADAPIVIPLELSIYKTAPTPTLTVPLVIHDPIVTFAHTAASEAENGTLAGVLDANALVSAVHELAGRISLSLCGSAFDGIEAQLRESEDILGDGSNAPGVACSAISIGLGFHASRVANPTTVGADPPTPPDPCSDAGAD